MKGSTGSSAQFLDFVERIGKSKAGRRALHVRLSMLRPHNRRHHHKRAAELTFQSFLADHEGTIFRLPNEDMVILTRSASDDQVQKQIDRLSALFSEDPLFHQTSDEKQVFCESIDIERNYGTLMALARNAGGLKPNGAAAPATRALRPLDPSNLGSIEAAIAQADLTSMVRRQPICAVADGQPPKPVFIEIFTSIDSLRQTLTPDVDILANRWLFQDLTRHLDRRMIAYLKRGDDKTLSRAFSINMNVGTLISDEFLDFDQALSRDKRATIVIELNLLDVFSDLSAFFFARNFLHDRGYRFCLDGVTHLSLPLIDRERLGFDLLKLMWGTDLYDRVHGEAGPMLRQAAERIGPGRMILARCDSDLATKTGAALGITLYQGHLFDGLLREALKKSGATHDMADAMARQRAASRTAAAR